MFQRQLLKYLIKIRLSLRSEWHNPRCNLGCTCLNIGCICMCLGGSWLCPGLPWLRPSVSMLKLGYLHLGLGDYHLSIIYSISELWGPYQNLCATDMLLNEKTIPFIISPNLNIIQFWTLKYLGPYSQHFIFFVKMNGHSKLEHYITLGWKAWQGTNTPAHWAHL